MTKTDACDKYNNLLINQKELIKNYILTTIEKCSEILNEDLNKKLGYNNDEDYKFIYI